MWIVYPKVGTDMPRFTLGAVLILFSSTVLAEDTQDVAARVEAAHGLAAWWRTEVLRADVLIEFGGRTVVDGRMTFETNGPRARLDVRDGGSVVYDGATCWATPDGPPNARFHVLTWSWFLAAPLKIRGHGSLLAPFETMTWEGTTHHVARQTFQADTGDTPEDWYDLVVDPDTHRLTDMGYVVTFGKTLEEANEEPHAIRYDGFTTVEGVTLSMDWTFTMYTRETGFGEPIGKGRIRNPTFIAAADADFAKPDGAVEVSLP